MALLVEDDEGRGGGEGGRGGGEVERGGGAVEEKLAGCWVFLAFSGTAAAVS